MKVKNTSARLHHVAGIMIAPGGEAEIPESFRHAIDKAELEEILPATNRTEMPHESDSGEEPKKRGRPKSKPDED